MNNFKKLFLVLLMVLALSFAFACGKEEDENKDDNQQEQNVETLKEIRVDVKDVKTEYQVGETVSYEGIKLTAVYSNTLTEDTEKEVTDLSKVSYKVVDAEDKEVTALDKCGKYSVVVSYEEKVCEYEINVKHSGFATLDELTEKVNNNAVASGEVVYGTYDDSTSGMVESKSEYSFGKNYLYLADDYGKYHYELLSSGNVFGINQYYDEWEQKDMLSPMSEVPAEQMNGADFREFLPEGYNTFGVEALVKDLYEVAKSEEALSFEEVEIAGCEVCGAKNAFEFKFEYIKDEFYYYIFDVKAELENGAYKNVEVTIKGYFAFNLTVDEETGAYVKPDNYDIDRYVKVSQVLGEKNAENPYPASDYILSDFNLYTADGVLVGSDVISASSGEEVVLTVKDLNPENANLEIDMINVSVLDENGEFSWNAFGFYSEGVITISSYVAGKFTVLVKSFNVEKTFEIEFGYSQLESFAPGVYDDLFGEVVEMNSVTVSVGEEVVIGAVVNSGANASFVATINGVELGSDGLNAFFTAEKAGTYVVVLTSKVDSTKTCELTIVVEEKSQDGVAGKYVGEYVHPMTGMANEFVIELYDDGTGSYSFMNGLNLGTLSYTFDGTLVLSNFVSTFGSEVEVVSLYSDGTIYASVTIDGGEFNVELYAESNQTETEVYKGYYTHPMTGMEVEFILEFNGDGTGYYNFMMGGYTGSFMYEGNTLFGFSNEFGAIVEFTAVYSEGTYYATIVFTDANQIVNVDFTKEGEEEAQAEVYKGIYVHPMTGMEVEFILEFNGDGTGYYNFMMGGYTGSFMYEGNTLFGFSNEFGAIVEFTAVYSEGTYYSTIVFTDANQTVNVDFTKEGEEEAQAEVYKGIYVHPMTGMEVEFILEFNGDGTGYYNFMMGGYTGSFMYDGNTLFGFSNEFGAIVEFTAVYSEGTYYATIVFTDANQTVNVDFTLAE